MPTTGGAGPDIEHAAAPTPGRAAAALVVVLLLSPVVAEAAEADSADAVCDAKPASPIPIANTTDKIARVLDILFMRSIFRES